jgi:hypothetical protein
MCLRSVKEHSTTLFRWASIRWDKQETHIGVTFLLLRIRREIVLVDYYSGTRQIGSANN